MTSTTPPNSPHSLQPLVPQDSVGQIDRTQSNGAPSNADQNVAQNGERQTGARSDAQNGTVQNTLMPTQTSRIEGDEIPAAPYIFQPAVNHNSFNTTSNTVLAQLQDPLITESGDRSDAIAPPAYGNLLATAENAFITQQVAEGSSGGSILQEEAEIREFDRVMALCLETMASIAVDIEQLERDIRAMHGLLPEPGNRWARLLEKVVEFQVTFQQGRTQLRERYAFLPPLGGGTDSGSGSSEGDAAEGTTELSRETDANGGHAEEQSGVV